MKDYIKQYNDSGGRGQLQNTSAPLQSGSARSYSMSSGQRRNWLRANMSGAARVDTPAIKRKTDAEKPKKTEKTKRSALKLILALVLLVMFILSFPVGKLVAANTVIKGFTLESKGSYTAEELAEAAGITLDSGLLTAGSRANEEKLLEAFPALSSCKITAHLDGSVVFAYSEYIPLIYFESAGKYFSADSELHILSESDGPDIYIEAGLIEAKLPQIKTAVVGDTLQLYGTDCSYIRTFLEETEGTGGNFTLISFENKFGIYAETGDGYVINYGSAEKLETKLLTVSRMLEEEGIDADALIDVSCEGRASIRSKGKKDN